MIDLSQPRHRDVWMTEFAALGEQGADACLRRVSWAIYTLRDSARGDQRKLLSTRSLFLEVNRRLQLLSGEGAEATALRLLLQSHGVAADELVPKRLTMRAIGDFVGQNPAKKFERRIEPSCALLLVEFLMDAGLLPIIGMAETASEQKLADALHRFFGASERTRRELRVQFEGQYFVYRLSAHWPGRFVKGKLEVMAVPIDGSAPLELALRAVERHVHNGSDGSAPAAETYVGVFSRKASYAFILSSETDVDGNARGAPRFSLIHRIIFRDGPRSVAVSMTGSTVSPLGQGHTWTSPVCIERADEQIDDAQLGIFDATAQDSTTGRRVIPESVFARLSK